MDKLVMLKEELHRLKCAQRGFSLCTEEEVSLSEVREVEQEIITLEEEIITLQYERNYEWREYDVMPIGKVGIRRRV